MLIDSDTIKNTIKDTKITGVLHIGAHDCEELIFYRDHFQIGADQIYWIEAIQCKVEEAQQRDIKNVYQAVITDKDDVNVVFHVSNNVQSSSVLELGTHRIEHPHVYYVDTFNTISITIDSWFERNGIDASALNFWNLDIQGCELMALQGARHSLRYVDVLYLEVNEKELYVGCGMMTDLDMFLNPYGFIRIETNMTQHGWGDAIYMKQLPTTVDNTYPLYTITA